MYIPTHKENAGATPAMTYHQKSSQRVAKMGNQTNGLNEWGKNGKWSEAFRLAFGHLGSRLRVHSLAALGREPFMGVLRSGWDNGYNRQGSFELEDMEISVAVCVFSMIHSHKLGATCEPHMRGMWNVFGPEGNSITLMLDCSMEVWNNIPWQKVSEPTEQNP
jgi:hypothetical protein